jgi:hypothetical protein
MAGLKSRERVGVWSRRSGQDLVGYALTNLDEGSRKRFHWTRERAETRNGSVADAGI